MLRMPRKCVIYKETYEELLLIAYGEYFQVCRQEILPLLQNAHILVKCFL